MGKKPAGEASGKLGPGSRYEGWYPKIIQKLSRKHKLIMRPNGLKQKTHPLSSFGLSKLIKAWYRCSARAKFMIKYPRQFSDNTSRHRSGW
ncbi:hypothetical protein EYC84_008334 [Monilinia fructicola]|uniref:Uncharacterized protein n=1 Tax=Monilinia fructicola TaxID=38448 RepID=A0A5M9JGK5_MONFR|nr:hypothetical protein EYC84_008334 [Monilinia fructicola]